MLKAKFSKMAVVVLSIFVVGMLAACAGESSSDDALTHPGDNMLGTMRFDVDPATSSVSVTPVGSPFSGTKIPGDGAGVIPNVTISTSNVAWAGDTMNFDVTVAWNRADAALNNVRIGANASTNLGVNLTNGDKCGGVAWSTCPLASNDSAVTWVSDLVSDGPEQRTVCTQGGSCQTQNLVEIHQGCGSVYAHWTLTGSGGASYRFWADLYGDINQMTDITTDPRYSTNTETYFTRVKKMTTTTTRYPAEGADSNQMASGEWFYVHIYLENAGDQAGGPAWTGNVNDPAQMAAIEDSGNIAQYQNGVVSTADYYYVRPAPWSIRFDPAIVYTNANDGSAPGNSALIFKTTKGTQLRTINDPQVPANTDGWDVTVLSYTASNKMGILYQLMTNAGYFAIPGRYPNPCGATQSGACGPASNGIAGADINLAFIPLQARTGLASGKGSYIKPSMDSYTIPMVYRTYGTYGTGDDSASPIGVPRSSTWPAWCERMPGGGCTTGGTGSYNLERTYICIQ